jgi:Uma2 family endonuclease
VDINGKCLEVYRQPSPNGYQIIQKYYQVQTLTIEAFSDVSFTVDEVLG